MTRVRNVEARKPEPPPIVPGPGHIGEQVHDHLDAQSLTRRLTPWARRAVVKRRGS